MTDEKDRRITELEEENRRLRREKDKISQEKDKIVKKFEEVKKEFEEFKTKHSKTVSELRRALKIKSDIHKSHKPLGAPKGHVGYSRRVPERIDIIRKREIYRCPHCNGKLSNTQEIKSRYITDVALTSEAMNTRYDIHRKYCARCKKLVEPSIPEALPHARFGLNLMLLVMYLKLGLRLSNSKVCDFFTTMYNLDISDGEISGILRQLVVAFGDHYAYLEKIVKFARVKYTDSTSWRINGKNYFAWVFVACGRVLYKIRKRNNSKSPLTVFGVMQKGNTLVIDRHSALRALAKKAKFDLQYCWSHILNDSKNLAKLYGSEGKHVHKHLKRTYAMAKSLNHKGKPEQVDQLKGEILMLTLRHYTHTTIRRFVNNLYYRDAENLFRFVTDPAIDATNNISERELRHIVLTRKISFGSKSPRGAHATAMLLSITQTLRLQNKNVLKGLHEIINSPSIS
jgi:hypothetical protein